MKCDKEKYLRFYSSLIDVVFAYGILHKLEKDNDLSDLDNDEIGK